MGEFKKVANVSEIELGQMKTFEIDFERILICNVDGKFYAIEDECSHDSAPISTGRLKNNILMCPRHGAKFDVTNGAVKAPPAIVPLETFEIKIDGNNILVKVGD